MSHVFCRFRCPAGSRDAEESSSSGGSSEATRADRPSLSGGMHQKAAALATLSPATRPGGTPRLQAGGCFVLCGLPVQEAEPDDVHSCLWQIGGCAGHLSDVSQLRVWPLNTVRPGLVLCILVRNCSVCNCSVLPPTASCLGPPKGAPRGHHIGVLKRETSVLSVVR